MRILYVDIDTLRPDHLGCYGYHRNTSPNIDAIAQRGLRFTDVYASDVPCLPSRTALISGMFGIRNGVANHGGVAGRKRVRTVSIPPPGYRSSSLPSKGRRHVSVGSFFYVTSKAFPTRKCARWLESARATNGSCSTGESPDGERSSMPRLRSVDDVVADTKRHCVSIGGRAGHRLSRRRSFPSGPQAVRGSSQDMP
jgi:hypothetical protein